MSLDVIAKIAAGEVVERPASVVKELMENSLDAGASRVEVHLTAGGKTRLQVRDNGQGIPREDMELLFSRHATSKIRSGADLDALVSLGFRGEALFSVSSVSELTLKSRAAGAAEAWEVKVRGGDRQRPSPAVLPSQGTDILIEEIFFNTPARKQFLKSDAAELDQAVNVFLPYALLYPQKHFVLTANGRGIYDLAAEAKGAARAARALALKAEYIITLENATNGAMALGGFLGDINIQRARRDLQFVFVNGRPVQSKSVLFHVNDVYRLIMPEGTHPFFALFLTVPPQEVDVNIHPAKREVRLKDEGRVGSLIRRAVEQALMTKGGPKQLVSRGLVSPEIFTFQPRPGAGAGGDAGRSVSGQEGLPPDRLVFGPNQRSEVPSFIPSGSFHDGRKGTEPVISRDLAGELPGQAPDFFTFTEQLAGQRDDSLKARLSRARLIGTLARKYHLFEEGEDLFVVDQHAAQERILFEQFSRQMTAGAVEVQRQLTPVVIRLSPRELLIWETYKPELDALGFESALMGEGAVALQAHPRLIRAPEPVFRALLSDDARGLPTRDMLARRACRSSVMSGETMQAGEAREQLGRLLACADPFTCPHGRPVFIEVKRTFLDRQFLRTS